MPWGAQVRARGIAHARQTQAGRAIQTRLRVLSSDDLCGDPPPPPVPGERGVMKAKGGARVGSVEGKIRRWRPKVQRGPI